jgi:hypothetical protein
MDWIKVKTNHILYEYNDLRDSEFVAWIKIMALTAVLEHEPTREQMLQYVNYQTLDSLSRKLHDHSIDLSSILHKVLMDVSYVAHRREALKINTQRYRERNKPVINDVIITSSLREDKIREDKNKESIKKEKSKLPLTDEQWFFEIKKNPAYKPLNIDNEKAKCEAWCMTNGKIMSRRRLINWLNRAEKPMEGGNGRRPGHGGGGPGLQATPREWVPDPPLSAEQIAENKRRLKALTGGADPPEAA